MSKLGAKKRMLFDLLNGVKAPWEIHEMTGLDTDRCEEIYNWYKSIPKEMYNE